MAQGEESPLGNLWFLGVILATLSCFISNLGLNLQKLLHLRNQSKTASVRESYHKFALWWLGLLLIVFGAIADFAALTFAPQSLVAPLGSLTLVSNIILSPIILKEVITTRDIIATLTIVTGCIVSVAFASHDNSVHTLQSLFNAFLRWQFGIYALIVVVFMVFVFVMIIHFESVENDPIRYTSSKEAWHRLAYPALSGTIGAQSVLFAKCLVEMIVDAYNNHSRFYERYQAYLIVAALVICIVLQIKWLNDGLLRFDASFEVPVFQAFWVVVSVISGMIFYREYSSMGIPQLCLFFLGVAITVSGVIMLSRGRRIYRPPATLRPTRSHRSSAASGGADGGSSATAADLSGLDESDPGLPGAAGGEIDRSCFDDDWNEVADRRARLGGAQGYGWVSSALNERQMGTVTDDSSSSGEDSATGDLGGVIEQENRRLGLHANSHARGHGSGSAGIGEGTGAAAARLSGVNGPFGGSSMANADLESSDDDDTAQRRGLLG